MKRIFISLTLCASLLAIDNVYAQKAVKGSVNKAETYLSKGDAKDAQIQIDAAFKNEKKNKVSSKPKSWFVKGQVYKTLAFDTVSSKEVNKEALETAVASFEKAKSLQKETGTYYVLADQQIEGIWGQLFNEGAERYGKGEYKTALESFDLAKLIKPQDTTVYLYSGVAASQGDMPKEALANFTKLTELGGGDVDIWKNMIFLAKELGGTENALVEVKKARVKYPDNKDLITQELVYLQELGKLDEALEAMKLAIKNEPSNAQFYYYLGYIYDAKKDYEGAVKAYKEAIEVNPEYFDAVFNVGVTYYNQGAAIWNKASNMDLSTYQKQGKKVEAEAKKFFTDAIPYFEQASALQPEDRQVLETLAQAYQRLNNVKKFDETQAKLDALDTE